MAEPGMLPLHSYDQIYELLKGQGATDYEADQLSAIGLAESGGDPNAHNPVGENSWGMFQINLDAHKGMNPQSARDPVASAFYALSLFRSQGKVPWSVTHSKWKGTDRDYRQYLQDPSDADKFKSVTAGDTAVITPPDVYGSEGQLIGSGLTIGGANFSFDEWPTIDDYDGDYDSYYNALSYYGSIFGAAGLSMPPGAPNLTQAAWLSAKKDSELAEADPTLKALNMARAAEIAQRIRQGDVLFPYDLRKIQQDIRLAEPFGSERVLRSSEGQRGYDDYWAGGPPTQKGKDYLAGFNLAKAGDEPRQTAVSTYLDTVMSEIGLEIELRGQNIEAAVAEIRGKVDTFDVASRAFEGIQKYTIPSGAKYVPGFEPDGFATSIGLKSWEASPVSYDPFQMGIDLLKSSPRPTGFEEPGLPGAHDPDMFQKAIDFYRGMI